MSTTPRDGIDGGSLSRRQAAALLGVSVATVRRLEGNQLHPSKGPDGTVLYDRAEVERLAAARPEHLRALPTPGEDVVAPTLVTSPADGDVAAMVFSDLDAGKAPTQIVIDRHLPPAVVRALHVEWAAMTGAVVVPARMVKQIAQLAGAATLTVDSLARFVAGLVRERAELRKFTYPWATCGKPIQARAGGEWQEVLATQVLRRWVHEGCAASEEDGGDE